MPYRIFSSIWGLDSLGVNSTILPQYRQPEMSPDVAKCPTGGRVIPTENHQFNIDQVLVFWALGVEQ